MEYKVTLILKSDLWPNEIQTEIEEAIEAECGHAIKLFSCFIDKE